MRLPTAEPGLMRALVILVFSLSELLQLTDIECGFQDGVSDRLGEMHEDLMCLAQASEPMAHQRELNRRRVGSLQISPGLRPSHSLSFTSVKSLTLPTVQTARER